MAASIRVADLHGSNRTEALQRLAQSLRDNGRIQIENHRVDPEIHEYLQLPQSTGIFTSFDVKNDGVQNCLRLRPIEEYILQWPNNPPCVRKLVAEYCRNVRELGLELHGAISESLGLDDSQQFSMYYYSNCPQPELIWEVLGDADTKIILVQLKDEVPSIQLLEGGRWVALNPITNTFTFTTGDQMQVLIAHDLKLPFTHAYGPRGSSLLAVISDTRTAVSSHAPPSPLNNW